MDSKKKGKRDDYVVDVAPGDDPPGIAGDVPSPPRNFDGNPWQSSRAGFSRMWANYRLALATSFQRMNRFQQETLIARMCLIITVGVTGLALELFYPLLNRTVKVFLVPLAIFTAWWVANRIITPVVLDRLANLLNDE
jgi:hypothetical protein